MKSHSETTHNHGNVPATEITHRSGIHTTTAGHTPPDASQGAGTPSGTFDVTSSKFQVRGFNTCSVSTIYYFLRIKYMYMFNHLYDLGQNFPLHHLQGKVSQ
jgi:hypothetical protein